jgi:hypothetical protein
MQAFTVFLIYIHTLILCRLLGFVASGIEQHVVIRTNIVELKVAFEFTLGRH